MKNKSIGMIVKAAFKSTAVMTVLFTAFTVVSYVLLLLAVGIMLPLGQNIEEKINNHILNREINAIITENVSYERRQERLNELSKLEHVISVYETPYEPTVTDENGVIFGEYTLSYIHRDYSPVITAGRAIEAQEQGVVLVPMRFNDYNAQTGIVTAVDGSTLIGKSLSLKASGGAVMSFEVVGAYDTTDPIFSGKELLASITDLLEYKKQMLESPDQNIYSGDSIYTVLVDSSKNTDEVLKKAEKITVCYTPKLLTNAEIYNIAFSVLLTASVIFATLTVFGFYIFLKGNVNMRTKELALYRAIGYSSGELYRIIFTGHILPVLVSVTLGAALYILLGSFVINPYLDSFLGDTFMKMTLSESPIVMGAVGIGYVIITLLVSAAAVKRSKKIDLTVLLKD